MILVACRGGGEHARAQEAGAYLPGRPRRYISRPALLEARLELTDQGMVSYALKTAYRDGTTHVVFERGGLPPLDFMTKLAALVPRPRTNLTRFHGVLAPNSRYRESVTALSARQVEPATSDVEADGPDEPDLRAGRRKGLCCTLKCIKAQRLKRVFNIEVSVCSVCGGPMRIIAESRTTALKIRWSSAKYCRTWKPQAVLHRQG